MNVGLIGLGLIGGSLAKAMKIHTSHTVYGTDVKDSVVLRAYLMEAIDGTLTDEMLPKCQLIILSLYPEDTLRVLSAIADKIHRDALVVDSCGVKTRICKEAEKIAAKYGFTFIGGHPMAGLEQSGFDYASERLFEKASMILTPNPCIRISQLETLKQFFLSIGFGKITISTPEEHDKVIAYTSQLAHVLSNAYIRNPIACQHQGFSAGSFKDMTRVATMNEPMWSELFFENKNNLVAEIKGMAERLLEYSQALETNNQEALIGLLKDGCQMKARCDKEE